MKKLALLAFILSCGALAGDVVLKNNGSALGPVSILNCSTDGGLACQRSTSQGNLHCAVATAFTRGCVEPGAAQSFGTGTKTFGGTVVTPLIDAGAAAIGTTYLEGQTFTAQGTSSTLLVQSDTADSTTSSTVAALTLKATANIAGTDAVLAVQDSVATNLLRVREDGTLNFVGHATDVGAVGVGGRNYLTATGSGGAATGATPAGNGGQWLVTTGGGGSSNGTAAAGNGGEFYVSTGAGGAASGSITGGVGGAIQLIVSTSGGGRIGGGVTISAGNAGHASTTYATDNGGQTTITGGNGGNAASFDTTAGAGGRVVLQSGAGGTSTVAQTSGAGGDIVLVSGNGGATTGGTGASSGYVLIDTGTPTGAVVAGNVEIGEDNAEQVRIGRATKTVTFPGLVVVDTSVAIGGGQAFTKAGKCTATIDFPNIVADTCNTQTMTCTGAASGDFVAPLIIAGAETTLVSVKHRISAADTLSITICNNAPAAAIDIASGTYGAAYFR